MGDSTKKAPTGAAVLQETVTSAITSAVFEELASVGAARMSMEGVARRAGVGKAALYRRWESKDAMLLELVSRTVRDHALIDVDSGSLLGDAEAYIRATFAQLRQPLVSRIAVDFLAESPRNPALAAAMQQTIAAQRRGVADAMLSRAVARGELPDDLDHDLALDLLVAPIMFRLLVVGGDFDDDTLHRLAIATVAGLKASHA